MLLERKILTAIAFASFAAVGAALFSQHVFSMLPCAWCVLQRLIFIAIGLVALVGALGTGNTLRRPISAALVVALSISGMAAAWHQLTVAALSFSCDQTLADKIMTKSGLEAAVPWLFGIYATCMDAAISILGLDFAVWSLLLFGVFAVSSLATLVVSCRLPRNRG